MATNNQYVIKNVEALYPRINKTYRFDSSENRSVPCEPLEDGARYEIKFRMSKEAAKALYVEMAQAYAGKKEASWPDKFDNPFTKEEDGTYVFKAGLKGAYGKDLTFKPIQYDAKGAKLPEDFLLTTGSTVNVAVTFTPYNMREAGVSLRLRAVQVIKYVPMTAASPFDAVEGGFEFAAEENPFEVVTDAPVYAAAKAEVTDTLFEDEEPVAPEPKKVVKKTAPAPKTDDDALASIVADWDD
jgi:hypothetical protein